MPIRQTSRLAYNSVRSFSRLAQLSSQFKPLHLQHTRSMATIPEKMRGVQIHETGGVDVLKYKTDLPVPSLNSGEILVKNEYCGINYIDTYFRTGLYPSKKPEILGREAVGTIASIAKDGNTYGLEVGDRVVWLGVSGYAEYTAAPAAKAIKVPSEIKSEVAVAALLQGLTAITLIQEAYLVKKDDLVLVHAAAGGVGLWLIQLLKSVGAKTIATASTKEKLELATENGATYVVNYKEEDIVKRVEEITGGKGVQVVYDSTGKDQFENDLKVVARKGTVVSYGNSSGAVPPISLTALAGKNVKLLRPTLFNYITEREEYEHYTNLLFDFITKDKLNVRIHETYPLADVARAHTDIESRKTTGKLILKVN